MELDLFCVLWSYVMFASRLKKQSSFTKTYPLNSGWWFILGQLQVCYEFVVSFSNKVIKLVSVIFKVLSSLGQLTHKQEVLLSSLSHDGWLSCKSVQNKIFKEETLGWGVEWSKCKAVVGKGASCICEDNASHQEINWVGWDLKKRSPVRP